MSWVQSYASINVLLLVVNLIQSTHSPYRRMVYGGLADGRKQATLLKKTWLKHFDQTLLSCKTSWVRIDTSINVLLLVCYLIRTRRRMVCGGWQIDDGKQASLLKTIINRTSSTIIIKGYFYLLCIRLKLIICNYIDLLYRMISNDRLFLLNYLSFRFIA